MLMAGTAPRRRVWPLAVPAFLLLVPFLVVPLLLILQRSLRVGTGTAANWSWGNYTRILTNEYYLEALLRTIALGAGIAVLTTVLGLPLAYIMTRHPRWRLPLTAAVTAPLFINVVVRLYGWQLLLSDSGPVNMVLAAALPEPIRFNGSLAGVVIVLVHVMLPYMVLSAANSMQRVDGAVWEAAGTLGANGLRVFLTMALPLALPGIIAGALIVFSLSASSYVVPAVMGGGRVNTFPTLVYQEAMALSYPTAAALALCLMVVLLPLARTSATLRSDVER